MLQAVRMNVNSTICGFACNILVYVSSWSIGIWVRWLSLRIPRVNIITEIANGRGALVHHDRSYYQESQIFFNGIFINTSIVYSIYPFSVNKYIENGHKYKRRVTSNKIGMIFLTPLSCAIAEKVFREKAWEIIGDTPNFQHLVYAFVFKRLCNFVYILIGYGVYIIIII